MKNVNAKTLKALKSLGLLVESGYSPAISLVSIEKKSGLRQVSNGAKVIREDAYPFNCFKIERQYAENGSLEAVKFNGYRDVAYEKSVIQANIKKKQEKINALMKLISEEQDNLDYLESCEEGNKIYSIKDIESYIYFND